MPNRFFMDTGEPERGDIDDLIYGDTATVPSDRLYAENTHRAPACS